MTASYPDAIKSFTTKVNGVDDVKAEHINDVQAEISAIETELGTNPRGSYASVAARLAASAVTSGTTLPSSPVAGQWFLHTPTGRKVLMMYNGSSWTPIISLGNMTLYVDGASGTDNQNKGYGTGANAFATIQYAINQIPGQYSGNVAIYVASGTYNELPTIRGKYPTGNYTITFYGAESTTNYTISTSTAGSNEVWATLTVSGAGWTTNEHVGKFLYCSGESYRPIVSNTSDTITVVGVYSSAPTGSFTLMTLQTQVYGFVVACDNVSFYSFKLTSPSNHCIYLQNARNVNIYSSYLLANSTIAVRFENSVGIVERCYVLLNGNTTNIYLNGLSNLTLKKCIVKQQSTKSGTGMEISYSSYLSFGYAANLINNFDYGIKIGSNSNAFLFITVSSSGKPIISNNTYGLYVSAGGQAIYTNTSYIYYAGNTTDRYADATSYGYYG